MGKGKHMNLVMNPKRNLFNRFCCCTKSFQIGSVGLFFVIKTHNFPKGGAYDFIIASFGAKLAAGESR